MGNFNVLVQKILGPTSKKHSLSFLVGSTREEGYGFLLKVKAGKGKHKWGTIHGRGKNICSRDVKEALTSCCANSL